jgi:hypothetical protein
VYHGPAESATGNLPHLIRSQILVEERQAQEQRQCAGPVRDLAFPGHARRFFDRHESYLHELCERALRLA